MNHQDNRPFSIDDWQVLPAEDLLKRGDDVVRLEPKAMEVLVYLAAHQGDVITREILERDVWHGAIIGYDAVTNTVIKLRKALQDDAREPRYIETIRKKGYKLIPAISYIEQGTTAPVTQDSGEMVITAQRPHSRRPAYRIVILSLVLLAVGITVPVWLWSTDSESIRETPSVMVLPFHNLSADPKHEYLANGITEDIITDLSRISNILVLASNTTFSYKGQQVVPEDVGKDLGVGYVLKGSIRQLGDEIRVTAQLVDTKTRFTMWAERYDRKVAEVFAVQDEVTQSIVKALAVKLTHQEKQRLARKTTDSLKAYDFFQEGQRLYKVNTRQMNQQARVMYRKAIDLDPGYGRAYGAMAISLAVDYRRGWSDSPKQDLAWAEQLAKKAVALDDTSPQTYWALSFVYLAMKDYDKAEQAATESTRIAPSFADGYALLAFIKSYLGQAKQAIALNDRAIRLNPYYSYEYLLTYGIAYYTVGNYSMAINSLEEAQQRNPNHIPIKFLLIACYVRADRLGDARWLATELQVLSPNTTISHIEKTIPLARADLRKALMADLRAAGLPE